MQYHFLLLSLIFAIPGAAFYGLRADLRIVIRRLMLCSIPFAFTESLFYPDYWKPIFLFDLADRIGFGLEDILFVMGLSAFTGTVYPVTFRQTLHPHESRTTRDIVRRLSVLFGLAALLTVLQVVLAIPMIYGAFITMLAISFGVGWIRRDLLIPSLLGGFLSAGVYLVLGWLLLFFVPEIFELNWNLDAFSATYVAQVPLEELMYGFAAGTLATIFYPFVFSCRYIRQKAVA